MNNDSATRQNELVIGCVTEPIAKYLQQAARLLLSLRWFGGNISDAPFILCTTGELSTDTKAFFKKHGAQIVLIDRFSDAHSTQEHGPSNKIQFFELDILDKYDQILLLDCDTIIVQDPSEYIFAEPLNTAGLSLKVADLPTVTTEQFGDLFSEFGLAMPPENHKHDITVEQCIAYFNSGVILLNAKWRENFFTAWSHYNKSIIDKWDSLDFNIFFTDQASLAITINAISIPVTSLPNTMNMAAHLPAHRYPDNFFGADPLIIHYHSLYNENGYVTETPLDQTNRRIDSFNARLRAEKMAAHAMQTMPTGIRRRTDSTPTPKIVVGSGWWCDNEQGDWEIGCKESRSIPFFSLWLTQVIKCLSPHKIIITDSRSLLKPDYAAYDLIEWLELDKNYGHANDIRTKKIDTKYSGFTRSVLQGCLYALNCDADYYVYVEQDCLIKGNDLLNKAIGTNEEDILIGAATEGGVGLDGKTAAPMKQQSLMIIKKSAMERFISGLLSTDWTDGETSPEVTMERQLQPLGTIAIPYGRSRPIDYKRSCFYAQHFTIDELNQFIQLEGLDKLWQHLTKQYYFECL
jgi:hypothetical protein